MALERGSFEVDGTTFPGYYDPDDDWNGFAVPYFTRDIAESIAKYWAEQAEAHPDYGVQTIAYDAVNDCYIQQSGGDTIEFDAGEAVATPEGLLTLYGIGSGYWAWSAIENAGRVGS